MKHLLLVLALFMFSCNVNTSLTNCPCVVTSVEKLANSEYKVSVQGYIKGYATKQSNSFTIRSEKLVKIGDTLKFN